MFSLVRYHLPTSLPPDRREELTQILTINGAVKANGISDATYIITNSDRFEGYQDVDENVSIVTVCVLGTFHSTFSDFEDSQDTWVDRSVVLGKMEK